MYRIEIQVQGAEGASLPSVVSALDLVKGRLSAGNTNGAGICGKVGFAFELREVDAAHSLQHLLASRHRRSTPEPMPLEYRAWVLSPERQAELEKLAAFARSHDNVARIVGNVVEVDSDELNINTNVWSTHTDAVSDMAQLRAVFGY